MAEYLDVLVGAAREHLPPAARLVIEPGRSLVARAGVTIYSVVTVKRGARTFVAVDGGMGDNLEVSLYGQRFEATVVDRVGGGEPVDLVGRHCESGDVLSAGVALREPRVGDVVAVPPRAPIASRCATATTARAARRSSSCATATRGSSCAARATTTCCA